MFFFLYALLTASAVSPDEAMQMQMAIDATARGGAAAFEDLAALVPGFREAVEQQPDLQGFYQLGRAMTALGDFPAARSALQSAVELEPTDTESAQLLAYVYDHLGEFEKAAEMWTVVVAQDPANAQTVYQLADSLKHAGYTGRAILGFEAVLALDPESIQPYEQLILIHQAQDDTAAVQATRDRLIRMHAASESPEIQGRQYFMRDRFAVDDLNVLAIEFFDPSTSPATWTLIVTDSQGYTGASFIVGRGEGESNDYMLGAILSDGTDWAYPNMPAPLTYDSVRQRITDILSPEVVVTPIAMP